MKKKKHCTRAVSASISVGNLFARLLKMSRLFAVIIFDLFYESILTSHSFIANNSVTLFNQFIKQHFLSSKPKIANGIWTLMSTIVGKWCTNEDIIQLTIHNLIRTMATVPMRKRKSQQKKPQLARCIDLSSPFNDLIH